MNSRVTTGLPAMPQYFLLGMIALLLLILFWFLSPFLATMFIAGVIVNAIYPFHEWLRKTTGLPRSLAALLTLSCTVILVLLPLVIILLSIVQQAAGAYINVLDYINNFSQQYPTFESWLSSFPLLQSWASTLSSSTPINMQGILHTAGKFIGGISTFLVEQTGNIIRNITIFVLHIIVFLMALFYFLRDGNRLIDYLRSLVPLPAEHRNLLFKKINGLMHAIIFGIFGASLAQGITLGMGLALAGVENAIFWAAAGTILSVIPFIGVGIIWIPITIALFVAGDWFSGVILLLWSLLVVTNIDNVIKPYIIGSSSSLHPFGVLVVLLGGVVAFGFRGLIFGPLVLSMTLAFLDIYRLEYQDMLQQRMSKLITRKGKS